MNTSHADVLKSDLTSPDVTFLEHRSLQIDQSSKRDRPQEFVFCLLPAFSMLSLCSAVETLRIANSLTGSPLYEWSFIGDETSELASSIGISVPVEKSLPPIGGNDALFVCGGANVEQGTSKKILGWLRKSARHGAAVGGLCTGTFAVAKAGLLFEKRATIHWENQHSLTEEFPDTEVTKTPVQIDEDRYSTAGGVSAIDLMLSLIAERHGNELAMRVSEQLMYTNAHFVQSGTTIDTADRNKINHPKLRQIIKIMEQKIEEPCSITVLAKSVNVSTRQLERLFQRHLNDSPVRYFTKMKLARAHDLLHQTDLTITQISFACGFGSLSHFSKIYKKKYGQSPHRLRNQPPSI